jgi:AAA+ superfamily predicted ATPase
MLNVIKHLANELQIAVVAAGVRAAFHALQSDLQLSNRFEPAILPRWEQGEEYLRLLASFERALPLRCPSHLTEERMALKLLGMIDGKIGELARLLAKAAVRAIQTGAGRIDRKTLEAVRWVTPEARKQLPLDVDHLA